MLGVHLPVKLSRLDPPERDRRVGTTARSLGVHLPVIVSKLDPLVNKIAGMLAGTAGVNVTCLLISENVVEL